MAQSFEGKLIYKVEIDLLKEFSSTGVSKEDVIKQMKSAGQYFDSLTFYIKDGNYIKQDNSELAKRQIYKSEENKIYIFQKDDEYLAIIDANKHFILNLGIPEPEFEISDSDQRILNKECKSLKIKYGTMGTEEYLYNESLLAIDPSLFKKHNYEYLNMIMERTHSYPLGIVKSINKFILVKMTLLEYSDEEIDDALFVLPAVEEVNNEEAQKIKNATGMELWKIKN